MNIFLEWRGSQDQEEGIAIYSMPGQKLTLSMPSFECARKVGSAMESVYLEGRRAGMLEITQVLYKTIDVIANKS